MLYTIYPCLYEDINSGIAWIPSGIIKERAIIIIKNEIKNESIYVDALSVDDNFINKWNEYSVEEYIENNKILYRKKIKRKKVTNYDQYVYLNDWYRKKLHVKKYEKIELKIEICNSLIGDIFALLQHPQAVVRISSKLGLLGVILGLLGIVPLIKEIYLIWK